MSENLDGIRARAKAYAEHGTPGLAAPRDRAALLAALEAALALAEDWRYKGPDPVGYALAGASADLRAVISDALEPTS